MPDVFERKPTAPEIIASEFITGKLHEQWHGTTVEHDRVHVLANRITDLENQLAQKQQARSSRHISSQKNRGDEREP